MSRHRLSSTKEPSTRGAITRALGVLEEAALAGAKCRTRGVALALWVLRGHCPDGWLVTFWDVAGGEHDIGRAQSLNACYNGILLRVEEGCRGGNETSTST